MHVVEFFGASWSDVSAPAKAEVLMAIKELSDKKNEIKFVEFNASKGADLERLIQYADKDNSESDLADPTVPFIVIDGKSFFVGYREGMKTIIKKMIEQGK